jgi:hypothetical protein
MSDELEVTQLFIPGLEPDEEEFIVEVNEEPLDPTAVKAIIESMRATLRASRERAGEEA